MHSGLKVLNVQQNKQIFQGWKCVSLTAILNSTQKGSIPVYCVDLVVLMTVFARGFHSCFCQNNNKKKKKVNNRLLELT